MDKKSMPEYRAWKQLRQRCVNRNLSSWKYYGARGIKCDERWNTFDNFLADMGKRPSENHSIERIDVNGNYSPSNCKWATKDEQQRNRRKYANNKTGHAGISFYQNLYDVSVGTRRIGRFKTLSEAVDAREKAREELWE